MNHAPLLPGHTAEVIPFRPRKRPTAPLAALGLLWWATSIQLAFLPLTVAEALSKKGE